MLILDDYDQTLVAKVRQAIRTAIEEAHAPVGVAKQIAAFAIRQRNRGRDAAKKRHPFSGICEASGLPIGACDAVLDELEPIRGYDGPVRWVCHKANNSGKRSCGKC